MGTFTEDFEGDLSQWPIQSGDVSLVANPSGSGTVLRCGCSSGGDDAYIGNDFSFYLVEPWTASFDLYVPYDTGAAIDAMGGSPVFTNGTVSSNLLMLGNGIPHLAPGDWPTTECVWLGGTTAFFGFTFTSTDPTARPQAVVPSGPGGPTTFTLDAWHTISVTQDPSIIFGVHNPWKIDGHDIGRMLSIDPDPNWQLGAIGHVLGAYGFGHTDEVYYIDNFVLTGSGPDTAPPPPVVPRSDNTLHVAVVTLRR